MPVKCKIVTCLRIFKEIKHFWTKYFFVRILTREALCRSKIFVKSHFMTIFVIFFVEERSLLEHSFVRYQQRWQNKRKGRKSLSRIN